MVGIIIVTHGDFGVAMLKTAEMILGKQEAVEAVSLPPELGREDLQKAVDAAMPRVNRGQGVLVMVDLWGGTPCNACLTFCDGETCDVLAGVSLPVLIEVLFKRATLGLKDLAKEARDKGRESVLLASEEMKRNA